jgi:broad specificity phosphatase PhoE
MPENQEFCTIYMVRHGETDHNINGIIQGQIDTELNAQGVEQATQAGKRLAPINFDAVFASDLLRAKRTAEIIVAEKQLAVNTTQLLRERHYGKYEGKSVLAYREENKELLVELEKMAKEQRREYKFDAEYESDNQVAGRLLTFLREVAITYAGKTVLMVSHGGAMRILLEHLGFKTTEEMTKIFIENTAHIKLASNGVEFNLLETNGVIIK